MPKKQTKKPKYPGELLVLLRRQGVKTYYDSYELAEEVVEEVSENETEVAIYKFDRMAKVTRTVKVE